MLGKRDRIVYMHLCRPLADPVIGGTAKHHILVNVFVKTQFSFHMYLSSLACFLLFSLCITNCQLGNLRPLPRASPVFLDGKSALLLRKCETAKFRKRHDGVCDILSSVGEFQAEIVLILILIQTGGINPAAHQLSAQPEHLLH